MRKHFSPSANGAVIKIEHPFQSPPDNIPPVCLSRCGLGADEWVGGTLPHTPPPLFVGLWASQIGSEGCKSVSGKIPQKLSRPVLMYILYLGNDCNILE